MAGVTQAKYLGIIICADLQWHSQICVVARKANTTCTSYPELQSAACPSPSHATACTEITNDHSLYLYFIT